jgi:hypothetical protein
MSEQISKLIYLFRFTKYTIDIDQSELQKGEKCSDWWSVLCSPLFLEEQWLGK